MKDVKFDDIKPPALNMVKVQETIFERKKNFKALIYALSITVFLFLIFIFVSWKTPEPTLPIKEDLVEISLDDINLGNDPNGAAGKIQPLVKGDFASENAANKQQNQATASNQSTEVSDPVTEDKDNADAPDVYKPLFKPAIPSHRVQTTPPSQNNSNPANNPTPAPVSPAKAKVGGPWKRPNGTATGNGAETDNGFRNQGNGNGTGDRGNPFGTPNGTGTRLTNANLKNRGEIERLAGQSGTNYKGTVTLKVRVDDNGNASLLSASVSPVTASSAAAKSFAKGIVSNMRFPAGADGREALIHLEFDY
jgi:hypothetical protein